jgi:DNA polymerase III gamma/tau subunit
MSFIATGNNDDMYNKEKFEKLVEFCDIPFLNQIWQMLLKGKAEMNSIAHPIEALEVLVIRISYSCQLPSLEEIVKKIKTDQNKELNIKNDNIGNDIRKILDAFPESKIIKN